MEFDPFWVKYTINEIDIQITYDRLLLEGYH